MCLKRLLITHVLVALEVQTMAARTAPLLQQSQPQQQLQQLLACTVDLPTLAPRIVGRRRRMG